MPNKKRPNTKAPKSGISQMLNTEIEPIYLISLLVVAVLMPLLIIVVIPRIKESKRIRDLSSASEECAALDIDIVRVSSPVIYMDTGISPSPVGMYAAYTITNNSSDSLEDVTVSAENFEGPAVSLAPNESGEKFITEISPRHTVTLFYYLVADHETDTPETHDLSLYKDDPSNRIPFCSTRFTATTQETIKANANKVLSVTYSPLIPEVGGTMTMQITGETGVIGEDRIFAFTPISYENWPADIFELSAASISLSGGNTGTFTDTLLLQDLNKQNTNYSIEYSFKIKGALPTPTPISPESYISSGQPIKHTNTKTPEYLSLAPVENPVNATVIKTKIPDPATMEGGGTVSYALTIENSGSTAVALDTIIDQLPDTPGTTTYLSGTSDYGDTPIDDPDISGQTLTWRGSFELLPGNTSVLTYDASIADTAGSYVNTAFARIGETQIDTTLDLTDNAPALAEVLVTTEEPVAEEGQAEDEDSEGEASEEESVEETDDEEMVDEPTEPGIPENTDGDTDIVAEQPTPAEEENIQTGTTDDSDSGDTEEVIDSSIDESSPTEESQTPPTDTEQDTTGTINEEQSSTGTPLATTELPFIEAFTNADIILKITLITSIIAGGAAAASAILLVLARPLKPMGLFLGGDDLTMSEKLSIAQKLCAKHYKMEDITVTTPKNKANRRKK